MPYIERNHWKKTITVADGVDYSTPFDMRGMAAVAIEASAGFGNAAVTVQWNSNDGDDEPDDTDTWHDILDADNSTIAAFTVEASAADYIELPVTAFGKPWIRLSLGGNNSGAKTLTVCGGS